MSTFDDLLKDKVVAEHPLLKGYHKMTEKRLAREMQAGDQGTLESGDLADIFSMQPGQAPATREITSMRDVIFEASRVLQDTLSQFILPIPPKVSYNNVRDIKYARNSQTEVVEGIVLFNVDFVSKSGIRKKASIAVKVIKGEALHPSIMDVDGRKYHVSQDGIDSVLERVTSYEKLELRSMYDAPLNSEERDLALNLRDSTGPQPRDNTPNYSNKVQAAKSTPPGWDEVLEEIGTAEDKGWDTFPRPWIYLLRNYILNYVSTADKDAWEPHLINRGIALNPWGGNRVRKTHGLDFEEEATPMEKEMDLEVSAPPVEMSELSEMEDMVEDVVEEVIQHMYPGTRTPIESGDAVKFEGGKMRGNIVEVNPEGNTLIVKSKGMEYRIKVEDIEPLPGTFKKMYM